MKLEDSLFNDEKNTIFLIGKDVGYSKSKPIHEAIYKFLNLNFNYEPISFTDVNKLTKFLNENNIISNVTYPYKQFCFQYFNNKIECDDASKFCQACNLIISNKQIYNFDGLGFVKFCEIKNIKLAGKNMLICGIGATAKSIFFALNNCDIKNICLASREPNKIENFDAKIFNYNQINEQLTNMDLIIDARPFNDEENLLDFSKIKSNTIVIDISYSDKASGIIKLANKYNIQNFDGQGMLICQAILCIQEICKTLNINNPDINNFQKLYNIGAKAINYH